MIRRLCTATPLSPLRSPTHRLRADYAKVKALADEVLLWSTLASIPPQLLLTLRFRPNPHPPVRCARLLLSQRAPTAIVLHVTPPL